MKNLFLTAICLLASYLASAQTSLEEYNYLTKGYKMQIESGLDMKKGYSFKEIAQYKNQKRTCTFKGLINDASHKQVGTLAIYQAANGLTYYFCIPALGSDEKLFNAYWTSLDEMNTVAVMKEYCYYLSLIGIR